MQSKNISVIPDIIICIHGCTEIEYLFIVCVIMLFVAIFVPSCIKCITSIRRDHFDNSYLEHITVEPLVNELQFTSDLEDDEVLIVEPNNTLENTDPKKATPDLPRAESPPTYSEIFNNKIQDIDSIFSRI